MGLVDVPRSSDGLFEMADLIRYDLLVQEALRGVVRQVLTEVAKNGLQGEHHFFVTFKTATPGLRLSNRMRERYPDEMTIILQHQFWGLTVADTGFEVGLSFHNTPERLFVPYAAITMFQDPSVNFGLKFDIRDGTTEASPPNEGESEAPKLESTSRSLASVPAAKLAPSLARTSADRASKLSEVKSGESKGSEPKKASSKPKVVLTKVPQPEPEPDGDDKGGTKVISIDAFRKKP